MGFQLGFCRFDQVSGPVSITLLRPTSALDQLIGHYTPGLLMLGDHHKTIDTLCEDIDENKFDTLHLYTPIWMRLLDSIGTHSLPVRYFVEANFPLDLLNKSYYLTEERHPWSYKIHDKSIMTYTAKFHPECFSKSQEIKRRCITTNVDYVFADLRLGIAFARLSDTDKKKIIDESLELADHLTPRLVLSKAKTAFKKQESEKSRQQKRMIYKSTSATYEAILTNSFKHALSVHRSLDAANVPTINGVSILKIIRLLYTDPKKCIETLFNITDDSSIDNLQYKSMLYKAMNNVLKTNSQTTLRDLCSLFYDYFVYVVQKDEELDFFKQELLEGVKNYKKDTLSIRRMRHERSHPQPEDSEEETDNEVENIKRKLKKYDEACKTMASTIFMPFNDMFFLFSTWSKDQYSALSLYHCGDQHSIYLYDFLIQRGLYVGQQVFSTEQDQTQSSEEEAQEEQHDDEDFIVDTDFLYQKQEQEEEKVKVETERVQCVNLTQEYIDVDQMIHDRVNQSQEIHQDLKQELKSHRYVIQERIKILGSLRYKQMLAGQLISRADFLSLCHQHNLTENQCVKRLELLSTNINFVPTEYQSKLRI
jgi:hypothetical protein